MTHKQRKALARAKAIRHERNVRQRNQPRVRMGSMFQPRGRVHRLWDF